MKAFHFAKDPDAITILDVASGDVKATLRTPVQSGDMVFKGISCMGFSADGALFAAEGSEGSTGVVRIWDVETSASVAILRGEFGPIWSRKGHWLATVGPTKEERLAATGGFGKRSQGSDWAIWIRR